MSDLDRLFVRLKPRMCREVPVPILAAPCAAPTGEAVLAEPIVAHSVVPA